jgi:cell division protein FtsL
MNGLAQTLEVLNKFDTEDWVMFILTAVILIGGICLILFLLSKVFKALKLAVGKDGVKLESAVLNTVEETQKKLYEDHIKDLEEQNKILSEANSNQHWMDDDNKVNDEHLKQRCQERTMTMRIRLKNDLLKVIDNGLVVSAICVNFRATFGNAIIRNHFTKELMPNRIIAYHDRIWNEVKEEYVSLQLLYDGVPPLESVEKVLRQFVTDWLEMMKEETITTCEEKIQTYLQYRSRFDKVPHLLEIVDSRIEKNKSYIEALK